MTLHRHFLFAFLARLFFILLFSVYAVIDRSQSGTPGRRLMRRDEVSVSRPVYSPQLSTFIFKPCAVRATSFCFLYFCSVEGNTTTTELSIAVNGTFSTHHRFLLRVYVAYYARDVQRHNQRASRSMVVSLKFYQVAQFLLSLNKRRPTRLFA